MTDILCEQRSLIAMINKLNRYFCRFSTCYADAEDLTQDVICKLIKSEKSYSDGIPDSHLYTLANCMMRDKNRRDTVRCADLHDECAGDQLVSNNSFGISPVQNLYEKQRFQRYLVALQKLSPRQRDVFLLSRYRGWTYSQIADHCGISISTIEKHMMKALVNVQRAIGI